MLWSVSSVVSSRTVEGESVRITAAGGTVKINQAPVVQAAMLKIPHTQVQAQDMPACLIWIDE